MRDYASFIASRRVAPIRDGIDPPADLNPALFPHQCDCVEFGLRAGRAAMFLDTGLGKGFVALEWGRIVARHTRKPVLILAPLAVAQQFIREAAKFRIECRQVREGAEVGPGVNVANYERLDRFDGIEFGGVVLDESGILKSFAGKTRRALTERFATTPFRLACTATPAPNDHMELGNHAEFLGIMSAQDMLHRWFINDTAEASQEWRLKGHAVESFWDWVCSWARCVSTPADLGYDDSAYRLPELREITHQVEGDLIANAGEGNLFRLSGISATNMHREQRLSLPARAARLARLVRAEPSEQWLLWCETDEQADAITAAIPEAIEVRGSHPAEWKEGRLIAFAEGQSRVLVTKPKLAGFGLNLQGCARMGFCALTFSYEAYYQAIRRCWRFGQMRPVHVHLLTSDGEAAIFQAVRRKAEQHEQMKSEMQAAVRRAQSRSSEVKRPYTPRHLASIPTWLKEAC